MDLASDTSGDLEGTQVNFEDVSYGYRKDALVLHKLSGKIAAPGITALVGPNGAGKTTFFKILTTLKRPLSGSIEVLGLNTSDRRNLPHIRRHIGYLPQTFGYDHSFTVRDFLAYSAWLKQVPNHRTSDLVARALHIVKLLDQQNTRMGHLSGGMLRRAGLAHAIVHEPKLLVLDEPTVGLDPMQRVAFRETLRALSSKTCIVLSTHLIEEVATTANSVLVMTNGKVAFQGTVSALTALGAHTDIGESAIERGYAAALRLSMSSKEIGA